MTRITAEPILVSAAYRSIKMRVCIMGNKILFHLCLVLLLFLVSGCEQLRPPAIPLVLHDPYFSCWSFGNPLYGDNTRHWTGKEHEMHGIIRVDGTPRTFMGLDKNLKAEQKSVKVTPTQTIYLFKCGPVDLTLTFTSPLLLTKPDTLSRPVTYISFEVKSNDKNAHDVKIYFDAAANWAVHDPYQAVEWKRLSAKGLKVLQMGSKDQNILGRKGDDVRIDWGHLYLAAEDSPDTKTVITHNASAQNMFKGTGDIPAADDTAMPRGANRKPPALVVTYNLDKVGSTKKLKHLMIAYNDIHSIEYFHRKLRPWWRRNETTTVETMLTSAEHDYKGIMQECKEFDEALMKEAKKSGGEEYAVLCAFSYRQAIAAHKFVADSIGRPLFFPKANFSNGSVGSIDVIYPSAPLFLLYNPMFLKGMMEPIFNYSESGRWNQPFAVQDLGTYPIANGQTHSEDMPIEECANMLLLTAAIAEVEKSASYAKSHWPLLTDWVEYLKKDGFDCSQQSCANGFASHLAGNTNLSVKTILAIASYAKLAEMLGYKEAASENLNFAKVLAGKWLQSADKGDHYSLTFDKKDSWSQKYNLVWDQLLDLNLFPKEAIQKEIKFYLTKQNQYGLPLDGRNSYTKSDLLLWTATLSDSQEDFQKLIHPVYLFLTGGPDIAPLSDWHETTHGKVVGYRARSVVGGYFIKILDDKLKEPGYQAKSKASVTF